MSTNSSERSANVENPGSLKTIYYFEKPQKRKGHSASKLVFHIDWKITSFYRQSSSIPVLRFPKYEHGRQHINPKSPAGAHQKIIDACVKQIAATSMVYWFVWKGLTMLICSTQKCFPQYVPTNKWVRCPDFATIVCWKSETRKLSDLNDFQQEDSLILIRPKQNKSSGGTLIRPNQNKSSGGTYDQAQACRNHRLNVDGFESCQWTPMITVPYIGRPFLVNKRGVACPMHTRNRKNVRPMKPMDPVGW